MGRRVDDFAQAISDLVREHVPGFDPATIERLDIESFYGENWEGSAGALRELSRE